MLFYSLALGALGFLNTWDMPIYIGLVALAYGAGLYARRRALDLELVLRVLALGVSLLVLSVLLYIFFYVSFSSQAGGILPFVFPPTRLPQYLVMFGIYLFLVVCFLAAFLRSQPAESRQGLVGRLLRTWLLVALLSLGLYLLILHPGRRPARNAPDRSQRPQYPRHPASLGRQLAGLCIGHHPDLPGFRSLAVPSSQLPAGAGHCQPVDPGALASRSAYRAKLEPTR